MGWEGLEWSISVTLDAHAGEKEKEHDALWRELDIRLTEVAREPRYAEIVTISPDKIEYEECGQEEGSTGYGLLCRLPRGHELLGPAGTGAHEARMWWGD
jgi:hypothetical protein